MHIKRIKVISKHSGIYFIHMYTHSRIQMHMHCEGADTGECVHTYI